MVSRFCFKNSVQGCPVMIASSHCTINPEAHKNWSSDTPAGQGWLFHRGRSKLQGDEAIAQGWQSLTCAMAEDIAQPHVTCPEWRLLQRGFKHREIEALEQLAGICVTPEGKDPAVPGTTASMPCFQAK